ncbi:MAG: aminotransferase class V-fold PLP-dependent enzyme, partial [Alistipes sp.]|nr:aminotransferase class V-fold PLP-dependent enzyme [Alistipes sp.]
MFDVKSIKSDFPILSQQVYGRELHYLDSAATSQKPQCVIDAIEKLYVESNSNVHRGVHYLAEEMTSLYEGARSAVRKYIGAKYDE